ncbi:hypothetical protein [Actinoalloteichus caeruleus]|uniref:ATP-binding protein n=1 Tax=Actinoalloteichus caeruleus DSM 43889 TaxID=1120930 RepID=A0ABT1JFP7_ACTCY|nr:hypothetical protein [Actinoalloteichus caeruleus]MCP2331248.1 hypothetical protein [Actinoalloteichus caeruleus DSM 43889]
MVGPAADGTSAPAPPGPPPAAPAFDGGQEVAGDGATLIGHNHGGTHQIYGDEVHHHAELINNGTLFVTSSDGRVRISRDPRHISRDHLRQLADRFVPPPNHAWAADQLAVRSMVLLTGPAGVGRRSAAQMLLHHDDDERARYRELPASSSESEGDVLDEKAIQPGERLLWDLASRPPQDPAELLIHLDSFRTTLRERGARLVVVLNEDQLSQVSGESRPLLVTLGRPDGRAVLANHLRADEIPFSEAELNDPRLDSHFESDPMRQLAKLAQLVRDAQHRASADLPLGRLLGQALEALDGHGDDVAQQVRSNPSAHFRALLLAAALLEGARLEPVQHAATGLLAKLHYPPEETHVLERPDLAERLAAVGAVTKDGRVTGFSTLAYGSAVLTHFWRYFPELRREFRAWVDSTMRLQGLTGRDRDLVVTRFAEQCIRTEQQGDLFSLVRDWSDRGESRSSPFLLPQVGRALDHGLADQRAGWRFREQILRWSQNRTLPVDLAQVLIRLCVEAIVPDHPDQALVRLHHLTRHQEDNVVASASDALDALAKDHRFLRRLLDRLATRMDTSGPHLHGDLRLFLQVTAPDRLTDPRGRARPLLAETQVRRHLVHCWALVLSHEPESGWEPSVSDWLAAVAEDTRREPLLTVLVDAAINAKALNPLYLTARRWALGRAVNAQDTAQRTHVARALHHHINRAQGLCPLGADRRAEETLA